MSESGTERTRLKGLDEFTPPDFVGRMERVRLRRALAFRGALILAALSGAVIGLAIF